MSPDDHEQPLASELCEENKPRICGFWRRVGAFTIDTLLLGLVGNLLGIFLFEQFSQWGPKGNIFGFLVAGIYLGSMNSKIGGGQTLGKKFLKIKVVDKNNLNLSLRKSFLRYSIFGIPYFLNGAFPTGFDWVVWEYVYYITVPGLGASIVYLLIFNRTTRQSLHDLLVNSYVIHRNSESSPFSKKPWKYHNVVVGALIIGPLFIPALTQSLWKNLPIKEMANITSSISEIESVSHVNQFQVEITTRFNDDNSKSNHISTQVSLKKDEIQNEVLANNIADQILKNFPDATSKNNLAITLTYGYNIGIASMGMNKTYNFTPSQWNMRINRQKSDI